MEYIYLFENQRLTLDELTPLIINEYVNTAIMKKELEKKYPISSVKLSKVLKNVKKNYVKCKICGEKDKTKFKKGSKTRCNPCILSECKLNYKNLTAEEKKLIILRQKKWGEKNVIKLRLGAAKCRARQKNLEFDLDDDFIRELYLKQNGKCEYSDEDIFIETNDVANSFSIERINSNLGYLKNNVVLTTINVNLMKNTLPIDSFLNLVEKIYKKKFLKKAT